MIGILLAAGRGTRMKGEKPKVLFEINDEPMCFAPLAALMPLCSKVVVVVGYRAADVEAALTQRATEVFGAKETNSKIGFALQDPPQGTGDAVKKAVESVGADKAAKEEILVLNGDLPLIRQQTLERMVKNAREAKMRSVCLSMRLARPSGLGRILRDETGVFTGIREEKDANANEKAIREVNGGVYYFAGDLLVEALKGLNSKNKQGEFYLTDLLGNRGDRFRRSEAVMVRSPWDLMGVNTTFELAGARRFAQARLQKKLCEEMGVDFLDPTTAYVSARAEFKGPCSIGPGTLIKGRTVIESGVSIEGQCLIDNSTIAAGAEIRWGSVLRDSKIGAKAQVGPMAHLRPGSELEADVKVGNFVELKKTRMGRGAKASHLSYLGDAKVGADVNIGCGTITCNYDGFNKHETIIGEGAFVGSDSQLIAPVEIGAGAYVASGTTVTQDVPADALALSRAPFTVKEGYASRLKSRTRSVKEKSKSSPGK